MLLAKLLLNSSLFLNISSHLLCHSKLLWMLPLLHNNITAVWFRERLRQAQRPVSNNGHNKKTQGVRRGQACLILPWMFSPPQTFHSGDFLNLTRFIYTVTQWIFEIFIQLRLHKIVVFTTSFGKESHSFPAWDNAEVHRQGRLIVPMWMGLGPHWPRGRQLWGQPRTVTSLLNKFTLPTRAAPAAPPPETVPCLTMAFRPWWDNLWGFLDVLAWAK